MGVKTARMAEKEVERTLSGAPAHPGESTPSQALPRQLSQRESQAVRLVAKVLGITRKLPAVLLPLPLGEVASPTGLDGEGARRQPYFKVSSVMRNFPATPKAPPLGELARRQA